MNPLKQGRFKNDDEIDDIDEDDEIDDQNEQKEISFFPHLVEK